MLPACWESPGKTLLPGLQTQGPSQEMLQHPEAHQALSHPKLKLPGKSHQGEELGQLHRTTLVGCPGSQSWYAAEPGLEPGLVWLPHLRPHHRTEDTGAQGA